MRGNGAAAADHHVAHARLGQHMPIAIAVAQRTIDLDVAVEQRQVVVGIEAEAGGVDRRGAGAIGATDGEILDAHQLADIGGRRIAVQEDTAASIAAAAVEQDVGSGVVRLQTDAGGGQVLQRGLGEVDVVGAQRQQVGAGVQVDGAGEVDRAVGIDGRTTKHGQRGVEVDVTAQAQQARQTLLTRRAAQALAAHGITKEQAATAQGDITVEGGDALGIGGGTKGEVQVAAVGVDRRIDGQCAAPPQIGVARQANVATRGGQRAGDGQAIGAQQGDAAGAGCAATDGVDIVIRQIGQRRIRARALGYQIEHPVDRTGSSTTGLHVDAAAAGNLQRVIAIGKADGGGGIAAVEHLGAEADIVLHRDRAITAIEVQIGKTNTVGSLQQHVGRLLLQGLFIHRHVTAASRPVATGAAAAGNGDIGRIEQQVTGTPLGRTGIGLAGVLQGLLAGYFGFATVTGLLATAHRNITGKTVIAVGPEHHRAAITSLGRIGLDLDVALDGHLSGIGHRGVLALPATTDLDGAATACATGVELGVSHGNALAGDHDAATLAVFRRHIERAGNLGQSALGVTIQQDTTTPLHQPLGLDDTGIVDDAIEQCIGRASAQGDHAAIGTDMPLVAHGRVEHAAFDVDADQAITLEIQADPVAGGKHRAAARRADGAAVAYLWPDQRHHAARRGIHATLVEHGTCAGTAIERGFTGKKILVADLQ